MGLEFNWSCLETNSSVLESTWLELDGIGLGCMALNLKRIIRFLDEISPVALLPLYQEKIAVKILAKCVSITQNPTKKASIL